MALFIQSLTILAGQSLSAPVDVGLGDLVRFYMPPAWTPANVTFQLSPDNITYANLYDQESGGREAMLGIAPGTCIVTGLQWRAMAWMKIRSGTVALPIIQTADRVFKLIVLK